MKIFIISKSISVILITTLLSFLTACGGGGGGETSSGSTPPPTPIQDSTPDNFSFTSQTDVSLNTVIESDSITISGINTTTKVSISSGEYSINNGSFTSADGTVSQGDNIKVRLTSSDTHETSIETTLTVGGVSATFSVTTELAPNAEFVEKAQAITFNTINLYKDHVKLTDENLIELDTTNLNSGDLITIDIEFTVNNLPDYALSAQLIPKSLFDQYGDFEQGTSLDKIIQNNNFVAADGEEIIELGGVYMDNFDPTMSHGIIHTKLPTLKKATKYRLIVTPSIPFLTADKQFEKKELKTIPVFFAENELNIAELTQVSTKIIEPPKLTDNNEFTRLDIGSKFDSNGFTTEPIFQSSVAIDITSFNASEKVSLTLNWLTPSGESLPVGLLSSDQQDNPVIDNQATFQIARNGGSSIKVPIVAYASKLVHKHMVNAATPIKDIANGAVETGEFVLKINTLDESGNTENTQEIGLDLPLVNQDFRPLISNPEDFDRYTVLRAGPGNEACLAVPTNALDIDTGKLVAGSTNNLIAQQCSDSDNLMLWRYDTTTEQLISKITDADGNNFCIEGIRELVVNPDNNRNQSSITSALGLLNEAKVKSCQFAQAPFPINTVSDKAIDSQRFIFDNNKIKLSIGNDSLTVTDIGGAKQNVEIIEDEALAADFARDTNGVDIDPSGRVFHIEKSNSHDVGNDIIKAVLSYESEAYVDYKPVVGLSSEGKIALSVEAFGKNVNIASADFTQKRYLSKQVSMVNGNNYPVEISNGAEANFKAFGLSKTIGEIKNSTVTESYDSTINITDALNSEADLNNPPEIRFENQVDRELFSATFVVFGIPINVSGDVKGNADLVGTLNFEQLGIATALNTDFNLQFAVAVAVGTSVLRGGLEAELEIINKVIGFSADSHIRADSISKKLKLEMNADADIKIQLLKGEIIVFVEYPRVCFCSSIGETVRKEKSLFESPYLINIDTKLMSGSLPVTLIKL